jgi:hypothetical protein
MKKLSLTLILLMTLASVSAIEYGGTSCKTTQDCIDRYGQDFVCIEGQKDQKICIEAEGKMMVPEFTGPAILVLLAIGAGAFYLLKKKKKQ